VHPDPKPLTDQIDRIGRQVTAILGESSREAEMATAVTTDGSPVGKALRFILTEMRHHVPYDSASVQKLRGSRLVIVGGVGFADLDVIVGESFDIDTSDCPNGEVIYRARPIIVRDTEHYRAFRRGLHVGVNIRSWLGVPLLRGTEILGMIALDKREPAFFTLEHQEVAMQFGALAAEAMART
jgi:GAF domain-containing protein